MEIGISKKNLIPSAVKAHRGIGATVVAAVGHFSPTFHPKKDRGHDCGDGGGGGGGGGGGSSSGSGRDCTTAERRRPRSSLSARGGESPWEASAR